jgi:hypothetical protein
MNTEIQILYFDMDNVPVDFPSGIDRLSKDTKKEFEGRLDKVPGIFILMKPVEGTVEAVRLLLQYFDCYILSIAPWKNPLAWAEILLDKRIAHSFMPCFFQRIIYEKKSSNSFLRRKYFIIFVTQVVLCIGAKWSKRQKLASF